MRPVSSPTLQSLPFICPMYRFNTFFFICPLFRFFVFLILIVYFETSSISTKSFYRSRLVIFTPSLFCLIYFGYFHTFSTSRFFPSPLFHFSVHIHLMFVILSTFFTNSSSIENVFSYLSHYLNSSAFITSG
jgi:hypothetical protein